MEGTEKVAETITGHFKKVATTSNPDSESSYLDDIQPIITEADNEILTETPSMEEIRKVVFSMEPDTTTGPDGFTPSFSR